MLLPLGSMTHQDIQISNTSNYDGLDEGLAGSKDYKDNRKLNRSLLPVNQ